ncbi:hypothetical protein Dsin_014643 [Dipteronia sinensis]|uniref:Uncharacterized protein n=1 Tax=Dipteronia sinensis TaxID=43782 RepID=A0AAE0EA07_9ROSI|nr:hypothetical protein Dsin_014643 [Dipteronia sinensis]
MTMRTQEALMEDDDLKNSQVSEEGLKLVPVVEAVDEGDLRTMWRSHNMKSRSCSERDKVLFQDSEVRDMKGWNIENEIVKVLEKGMALGCDFYGKKKEMIEIMATRNEDTRFHELVRILVSKIKPIG